MKLTRKEIQVQLDRFKEKTKHGKGKTKMEILKTLNLGKLTQASKGPTIACPFDIYYGGPITFPVPERAQIESHCQNLCGKLFPRIYQPNRCPCWHTNRVYIKKTFWKKLKEARKGDNPND